MRRRQNMKYNWRHFLCLTFYISVLPVCLQSILKHLHFHFSSNESAEEKIFINHKNLNWNHSQCGWRKGSEYFKEVMINRKWNKFRCLALIFQYFNILFYIFDNSWNGPSFSVSSYREVCLSFTRVLFVLFASSNILVNPNYSLIRYTILLISSLMRFSQHFMCIVADIPRSVSWSIKNQPLFSISSVQLNVSTFIMLPDFYTFTRQLAKREK